MVTTTVQFTHVKLGAASADGAENLFTVEMLTDKAGDYKLLPGHAMKLLNAIKHSDKKGKGTSDEEDRGDDHQSDKKPVSREIF